MGQESRFMIGCFYTLFDAHVFPIFWLILQEYCIIFADIKEMYGKSKSSLKVIILFFFFAYMTFNTIFYPFGDSRITYHGRYFTDDTGLRYDWPCFRIQFCFANATKVSWVGFDRFSHYHSILNKNQTKLIIPKMKTKIILYQNTKLSSQINCIQFVKITQDHFGPLGTIKDALFKGIQMQGNSPQLVKSQNVYKYKLQFIGDSLTVGYGDMSGTNIKCFLRMRHNQNCLQSWATHLSNKLNAKYRLIAQSGKGVVKNSKMIFGQTMPVLFTKTTSNSKANTYNYQDKYTPDAVLVFLGVNDFNSWIAPGVNSFIYGYQKMLQQIVNMQYYNLGRQPKIIGLCSLDLGDKLCQTIKSAIAAFKYSYQHVYYVQVPPGIFIKGNMGCIQHPNYKGQKLVAEAVYQQVKDILEH